MPYMRPFRGGYAVCADVGYRDAFVVSTATAHTWDYLCQTAGHNRPTNDLGYRVRPYPAMNVASHAPFAPDGVYTDHRDPAVQLAAYEMRNRLLRERAGSRQEVLATIATVLRMRHWRDAYNCTRNEGRRHTGESGRNADGDLVWRRWNNRPWSATATATVRSNGHRAFGVELEYVGSADEYGIAAAARAAGLTFTDCWGSYGSAPGGRRRAPGWLGTSDCTVSGEIISDILPGDDASLAQVSTMLRIIRDHGGQAGHNQGIHVNHDARDFTLDDKVRLIDNLQACQDLLLAYLPAGRRNGDWCHRLTDNDWANERSNVAAGYGGSGSHHLGFNFGHLFEGSMTRVEFRQFGHSLNSTKLRVWVRVTQAVMTATKAGIDMTGVRSTAQMLAVLRDHGRLSEWAADRFAQTCINRSGGRAAAA